MAKATRLNAEQFVKLYMESESAKDAAKRMGCTENNVYSRRRELKAAGVNLPDFPKSDRKGEKDIAGLNALIASLSGGKSGETAEKSETETKAPEGETVTVAAN